MEDLIFENITPPTTPKAKRRELAQASHPIQHGIFPLNPVLSPLPREVRNIIYAYALSRPMVLFDHRSPNPPQEPGLLKTCRQVRHEARPIFYATNNFFAVIDLAEPASLRRFPQWIETINFPAYQHITSFSITEYSGRNTQDIQLRRLYRTDPRGYRPRAIRKFLRSLPPAVVSKIDVVHTIASDRGSAEWYHELEWYDGFGEEEETDHRDKQISSALVWREIDWNPPERSAMRREVLLSGIVDPKRETFLHLYEHLIE